MEIFGVGIVLGLALGLFAGVYFGGRLATSRDSGELGAEQARREASEAALAREKQIFESQLAEMKTTFQGLASETLEASNKNFLGLATERMKPLKDQLDKLQAETRQMEEKRSKAYGSLASELEALRLSTVSLQEQSTALSNTLRGSSQARGMIGEMILRNIVELAGMTKHCDFVEQKQTSGGGRPDIVVHLPGGGSIPIDAKFPLAAFQDAIRSDDPGVRDAKLVEHANALKGHVDALKKRDYSAELAGDVDFTVLFLPGDHLLAAAYEYKPDLQEKALADRILIATPVTLVALLRTVGLYWKQNDLAKGAREIQEQADELHKRIRVFVNHFASVGKHLGQAQDAFNSAVGSYQSRVLPAGQKLEALNATREELPEVEPVEKAMRTLPAGSSAEPSDSDEA